MNQQEALLVEEFHGTAYLVGLLPFFHFVTTQCKGGGQIKNALCVGGGPPTITRLGCSVHFSDWLMCYARSLQIT